MDNELLKALELHKKIAVYRDELYITTIQKMQEETAKILKPDLGSRFVENCVRDIAGEVVRNYFDTSDYHITVDQLARRIKEFDYDNEYDPLGDSAQLRKSVYNYNDVSSSTLDKISEDLDADQHKLFDVERSHDSSDQSARKKYRESKVDDAGDLYDDITREKGQQNTVIRNGKETLLSDLHADHIQAREAASYNSRLITERGVEELRQFINSDDNMQLMHASANTSKGDIRVCQIGGKIVYKNSKESDYDSSTDITYKATPEQLVEATCQQWEKDGEPHKIQKLKEKGYLNEDGKVPELVRKKLEDNIRRSQNVESKTILRNTRYGQVAKDAAKHVGSSVGKVIVGQVIYYAAPPIIYEVRKIVSDGKIKLSNAMEHLTEVGESIVNYVCAHLKDIFANVAVNSLKKFIKTFMDILIGMVKATVKKLLKIIKTLVMSVVDSIKIIVKPGASAAQKADAVFKLMGVTVTNIILEVLFEAIEKGLNIPEFLLAPLQILTSVVCTNFVMLILEKADVFNVRFGFQMRALEEMFERERNNYKEQVKAYSAQTHAQVDQLLNKVKAECKEMCNSLKTMNPYEDSVRGALEQVSRIFNMNIDFEAEWQQFLSRPTVELGA